MSQIEFEVEKTGPWEAQFRNKNTGEVLFNVVGHRQLEAIIPLIKMASSHARLVAALENFTGDLMIRRNEDGEPACRYCGGTYHRDSYFNTDEKLHRHDCPYLPAKAALKEAKGE